MLLLDYKQGGLLKSLEGHWGPTRVNYHRVYYASGLTSTDGVFFASQMAFASSHLTDGRRNSYHHRRIYGLFPKLSIERLFDSS